MTGHVDRNDAAPLVSVVIPMHNHSAYIGPCLDSILQEDYPNVEVLIADDGSDDGSFEAAMRWRKQNPMAFVQFELSRHANRGAVKTVNALIQSSRGELIAPLASDDLLVKGGLKARVAALQRHPEWLAVFGDAVVVNDRGKIIHRSAIEDLFGGNKIALKDPRFVKNELIWRWSVPGPVLMAWRSLYFTKAGVGLYDENLVIEDRDFYLRLLAKNLVGFIDRTVAAYRRHPENSTKSKTLSRKLELYRSQYIATRNNISYFNGFSKLGVWLFGEAHLSQINMWNNTSFLDVIKKLLISISIRLFYNLHKMSVKISSREKKVYRLKIQKLYRYLS